MKKSKGLYDNIQFLALAAVEKPDNAYIHRRIQRIYSTTFHVPLTETESIPVEEMLQHIFEHRYENMTPTERAKEAKQLLAPISKIEEAIETEDEDEAWVAEEFKKFEIEERERKAKKAEKAKETNPLPDPPPDLSIKFDE